MKDATGEVLGGSGCIVLVYWGVCRFFFLFGGAVAPFFGETVAPFSIRHAVTPFSIGEESVGRTSIRKGIVTT